MTTYKFVKSPLLNIFKTSNPESGRTIQLKQGDKVEVLTEDVEGKKGVNTHVRFTNEQGKTFDGYVAGAYLEASTAASEETPPTQTPQTPPNSVEVPATQTESYPKMTKKQSKE